MSVAYGSSLTLNADSLTVLGFIQGFGSGSGLDPYSIGPVDPDPDSEYGSEGQEGKNDPQK